MSTKNTYIFPVEEKEKERAVHNKIEELFNSNNSKTISDPDYYYWKSKMLLSNISSNAKLLLITAKFMYSKSFYTHAASLLLEAMLKEPYNHDIYFLLGVIHQTTTARQDAKIAFNKNLLCLNKQNPLYWNGQTKENSILIVANGVGECVLASRQINSLRQYTKRVGMITKPQFHELAGSIKNIDFCLFSDNPIKGGEKFIQEQNRGIKLVRTEPIMSMNEDIFSHPLRHEKSINVKPNLDSYWRAQMNSAKDGSIPLIGLCWNTKQISPLHPNRSFKLEDLRIVSNLDHYKLASFQNGYGSEQLDVCDFKESFVSCQQELSEKETLTLLLLLINVIISSHVILV